MSSRERVKFRHVTFIIPFKGYPRVHYFRARIKDFEKRFNRVIDKLPIKVPDENVKTCLSDMVNTLDKNLKVIVIGKETLPLEDLSDSSQYTDTMEEMSTSPCVTIVICHVTVEMLDKESIEMIVLAAQQILTAVTNQDIVDTVIIFCKTKGRSTDEEITQFRNDVQLEIESSVSLSVDTTNIIISAENGDLRHSLSSIFETRIIEVFTKTRLFLCLFVNTSRRLKPIDTIESNTMVNAVLEFLRNGFNICDIVYTHHNRKYFLHQIIERLARYVRCAITGPVASRHAVPYWLCTRLLNEIEFEDTLIRSVSNKSRYFLGKLERFYISAKTVTQDLTNGKHVCDSKIRNISQCFAFDFVLPPLKRDFEAAASKTEHTVSSMKRSLVVMGKLIHEIDGYLKQTIVQQDQIFKKEPALKIPDGLRRKILSLQGVYGIGTIYGEIEIHLIQDKNEDTFPNLSARLQSLMRDHHLQNSYKIKLIKR